MKKIAIVSTHAIQYNAPWFQQLAQTTNIQVKVFYTWSQTQTIVKDKNFGKEIKWDIPLLEGYDFEFVENIAKKPGSHHFKGIDNPTLVAKIQAFSPDVVLVFGWKFKSHLKVMRFFKKRIPVWFRGDSTLLDDTSGIKSMLRGMVLRWVYSYIDKGLYVGSANKAYFKHYGLRDNQLIYAPHAVDNKRFTGNKDTNYEEQAQAWRKELGYAAEDIVILYAGKFEGKKQPDFLMKALLKANLKRQDPLHLLLIGQGQLENELKKIAGDHKTIKFASFINQKKMPVAYRVGNVFCLPSKGPGETWGLAVNEAMASGRPAIVSDKVGCATDLVIDEVGWTFKHDQAQQLIDVLVQLNRGVIAEKSHFTNQQIQAFCYDAIIQAIENNI